MREHQQPRQVEPHHPPAPTRPVVMTLRTDSYDCPHCGVIVVATDDLVVELSDCHECRS